MQLILALPKTFHLALRYDVHVKAKLKPFAGYDKFQSALRTVLRVSKADLTRMLADEKAANQGKSKRGPKPKQSSTSDHASSETH
jgi:hypothetical protein